MPFIQLISMMIGLYLVTAGLWELRTGRDKKRFMTLMFPGLILTFVFPLLLGFGLGMIGMLNPGR